MNLESVSPTYPKVKFVLLHVNPLINFAIFRNSSLHNCEIDRHNQTFREDLFYRLGVIKVELPSLQDCREDIISLSKFFLVDFNRKFKKNIRGISPEANETLRNYPWNGNIRELKNVIERGSLICEGPELTIGDLGLSGSQRAQNPAGHETRRFLQKTRLPTFHYETLRPG